MALGSAATHLNVNRVSRIFSTSLHNRISRIKNLYAAIYAKRLTCQLLVWDIETVPDLAGFAAANGHDGKKR
jgi:hypothetical protein